MASSSVTAAAAAMSSRAQRSHGSLALKAATPTTRRRASSAACGPVAASGLTIKETFQEIKEKNGCAFIPFICAGDPNLDATEKALKILDDVGADIIELGVPYSDPLADGPVIQVG